MKWQTKTSGKGFYILIQLFIFLAVYLLVVFRMQRKSGKDFLQLLVGGLIFFGVFLMAWLLAIPPMIIKKNIPKTIEIDEETGRLHISLRKNKKIELEKSDFEFLFYERGFFSCLVIYQLIRSTRGHLVSKERVSIIGNKLGLGWNSDELMKVSDYLKENGYNSTEREINKNIIARFTDK